MVQKESKNSYLLLSGQRRLAALKRLGAKKITGQADYYLFGHTHGFDRVPVLSWFVNHLLDLKSGDNIYTSAGLASPRLMETEIAIVTLEP